MARPSASRWRPPWLTRSWRKPWPRSRSKATLASSACGLVGGSQAPKPSTRRGSGGVESTRLTSPSMSGSPRAPPQTTTNCVSAARKARARSACCRRLFDFGQTARPRAATSAGGRPDAARGDGGENRPGRRRATGRSARWRLLEPARSDGQRSRARRPGEPAPRRPKASAQDAGARSGGDLSGFLACDMDRGLSLLPTGRRPRESPQFTLWILWLRKGNEMENASGRGTEA